MSGYCDIAPGHPFHGPYHDKEYGFPLKDDAALFERLSLEVFQAGLSWLIVLKKRDAFYAAFKEFDPAKVARFGEKDIERLMDDSGIIRNRLKLQATVTNAQVILELARTHGSFSSWIGAQSAKSLEEWVKIFRKTFKFMGREVVNEFLMSTGYLPGAHRSSCPIYARILKKKPAWSRS